MSTVFHNSSYGSPPCEKVVQLCQWIDANIQEQIGWSDLTRQSGMEHKLIMFSFNKYLGTTPMTWIRQRREQLNKPAARPLVNDTQHGAFALRRTLEQQTAPLSDLLAKRDET